MSQAARTWIAFAVALSHWALMLTIQTGSFCLYLMPAGSQPRDTLKYLSAIPFLQSQTLAVSLGLALVSWLLAGHRWSRWITPLLQLAVAGCLLTDLLFYRISRDHLRPSFFEMGTHWDASAALSSLTQHTDGLFIAACAVALAGELWLLRLLGQPPRNAPHWRPWTWAAGILFLAGIPAFASVRYFHLNEHLFFAAAQDWAAGNITDSVGHRQATFTTTAVTQPSAVDHNPQLAGLSGIAAKLRHGRRPNVVLIVMESVGALNLLTDKGGGPSPLYAPNLAQLARRGVLFDTLYVPAPATARSHTTLHTGGRGLTRGGPRELEHRYQGPMLGRSMQQLGYATALFSSQRTDVEAMDAILEQGGYGHFQTIERDIAHLDPANLIHSWGAREEYTVGLIEKWIGVQETATQPFYLEYINAASHHPYGAPSAGPIGKQDDRSLYLSSIHYTDQAIGYLVTVLANKGLLDDTVLLVTGDHGEAFGDRHRMNTLHKNFIYEENVRSFLLMVDPRWALTESLHPVRIGHNGDIMPTLLAYLQAPDATLAGRDLLTETFVSRPVHFFKNARPEQWGLRDGNWKFIAEIRTGRAELYDLSIDPGEQHDLSAQHPERVAQYAAQCEEWFLRTDEEYTARLENYRPSGKRKLGLAESFKPGPKLQSLGLDKDGKFTETARLSTQDRAVIWTRWAEGASHTARWQWRSPSGVTWASQMSVNSEWTDTYHPFPGPLPMEAGPWTVSMVAPRRTGIANHFTATK